MKMLRNTLLSVTTALFLSACWFQDPAIKQVEKFITEQKVDKHDEKWRTKLTIPPKLTFAEDATYYWVLQTTLGEMKFELFHKTAPMHASSTIYLTTLGFYDSLTFHRVINDFMAQGGDPLGNGQGFPGYRYAGEFEPLVPHDQKGLLSMANAGPNTDGSQFFITFRPTPHLNGRHTVFGKLVSDEKVLDLFNENGSRGGKPKQQLVIQSAKIIVE
ncbi:peptidylprolyl isomerase [Pseudoalteromonas sp. G4]|uniref:peptidylprolyl isomerase n=1 Tax=Pseudoalteromonas sp. G4 TaxID=2992761 RepID=UPI00237DDFD3|nr:peptidylprolyl isomerase [Pseudoalteromonas sp. G4]MDE3271129.1 peptidylprolyl isomerase [Pseudoalteromonas sp. G4]